MLAATHELNRYAEFDYVIINDNFDIALKELDTVLSAASLRRCTQQEKINLLFPELDEPPAL